MIQQYPARPAGLTWYKSSHSAENGSCVEVAATAAHRAVRDSKRPGGTPLRFSPTAFAAMLDVVTRS